MPRYIVSITKTITVTASDEDEARAVGQEYMELYGPETLDIEAEKRGA